MTAMTFTPAELLTKCFTDYTYFAPCEDNGYKPPIEASWPGTPPTKRKGNKG